MLDLQKRSLPKFSSSLRTGEERRRSEQNVYEKPIPQAVFTICTHLATKPVVYQSLESTHMGLTRPVCYAGKVTFKYPSIQLQLWQQQATGGQTWTEPARSRVKP